MHHQAMFIGFELIHSANLCIFPMGLTTMTLQDHISGGVIPMIFPQPLRCAAPPIINPGMNTMKHIIIGVEQLSHLSSGNLKLLFEIFEDNQL